MMWGYDGFGFGGGTMGIGMLLFWGLILIFVVALVRGFGGQSRGGDAQSRPGTALDILGERFARGEINQSEFEDMRRTLSASGG